MKEEAKKFINHGDGYSDTQPKCLLMKEFLLQLLGLLSVESLHPVVLSGLFLLQTNPLSCGVADLYLINMSM